MNAKRAAIGVAVALVVLWALQGGEYGTSDLFRQRARRAALQAEVDSLERHVDSLRAYKRALQTDAALQERIAREEFGMLRGDRELLFRFAEPGSSATSAPSDGPRGTAPAEP